MPRKFDSSVTQSADSLRILLITSDVSYKELACAHLAPLGFSVEAVLSGCAGIQRANQNPRHAILIDEDLRDIHWLDLLRKIRAFTTAPILVLSGAESDANRIAGLNQGADDYFSKEVVQAEFIARVRAAVRRAGWASHEAPVPVIKEVVVGTLRLRLSTFTAFLGEAPLNLTRTEFEVLLTLARSAGEVCTREQLVESSKGGVWQVFDRGIDMHISALRRALGDESKEPKYIKTVRGLGYVLTVPNALTTPDAPPRR